jgi:hypothetical protein
MSTLRVVVTGNGEKRATVSAGPASHGASLNTAAEQAKELSSAGASITALGCSAAVLIAWAP